MNCGIPYCHNGCPVNDQIPDWNGLAYRGEWEEAARNLLSTNNFPEFTGRVAPRRARRPARSTSRTRRSPSRRSSARSRPRLRRRLGQARAAGQDRQVGRGRRVRPRRPRLRPAARPRRPRRPRLRKARQGRRPPALRHSGFQAREAHIERRIAQMEAKASRSTITRMSARRSAPGSSSIATMQSRSPAAPRPRATCPCRGGSSRGVHFAMDFCRSRTGASRASRSDQPADPRRAASTSS